MALQTTLQPESSFIVLKKINLDREQLLGFGSEIEKKQLVHLLIVQPKVHYFKNRSW